MRRVIVMAAAGLSLAGCSSFSLDAFKSAPEPVSVQFESTPPGAEARTSLGPSCTTPCSLPITVDGGFSVTFNLPKFQPATVPVTITRVPGDFTSPARTTVDPNPVAVELQPIAPPRRGRRGPAKRTAKPGAAAGSAAFPPPR
ncbi:MAG: hypothetical protein ABW213_06495 [Tardiphaga sp.]